MPWRKIKKIYIFLNVWKIKLFFFPFCPFCGFQNVCWRNIYDCGSTDKFSSKLTRLAVSLALSFFSFFLFLQKLLLSLEDSVSFSSRFEYLYPISKDIPHYELHFSNKGGEFSCFCYSLGPKWLI